MFEVLFIPIFGWVDGFWEVFWETLTFSTSEVMFLGPFTLQNWAVLSLPVPLESYSLLESYLGAESCLTSFWLGYSCWISYFFLELSSGLTTCTSIFGYSSSNEGSLGNEASDGWCNFKSPWEVIFLSWSFSARIIRSGSMFFWEKRDL